MKRLILPFIAILSMAFTSASAQQKKSEKKGEKNEDKKVVVIKNDDDRHPGGLNLTEDQQKKMEEIHGRTRKETVVLQNQIAEKKAHLKTLMSMDKPDLNDVNKTVDEMQLLKSQVMKKELAAKIESRSILTDEQRAMMPEMDMFGDNMHGQHFMFNMEGGDGNMMFMHSGDDEDGNRKVIRKKIKINCDEGDDD